MTSARHAGAVLAECLAAQGASLVFGVPGESYLPLLDGIAGLAPRLRFIAARHEAGAANMAVAVGKLTGAPGIAAVSRGPGATHAAIAVHTAHQDSAPLILLIGQIARQDRDREAFQEVDYRRFFAPMAKWVAEIETPSRIPEYIARAFLVSTQGRPGPVVLSLPEDMLAEPCAAAPIVAAQPSPAAPSAAAVAALRQRLEAARRPLALVGRIGWTQAAADGLAAFAARTGLPVACGFRAKDQFPNDHPCYAGDLGLGPNPALLARAKEADLVLAIGARLDENTMSGYAWLDPAQAADRLVQVLPGPDLFGQVYQPGLAITAEAAAFVEALGGLTGFDGRWTAEAEAAHGALQAWSAPVRVGAGVNLAEAFAAMRTMLPADAIVANGAGNFAAWLHRYFPHPMPGTQLAPISGAMGFGVPAAAAAKILAPQRTVVCVAGDGDFLMSAQELATARAHGPAPVVIVCDNAAYGTIRMHQEREFPGRESGTDLWSPDFAVMGRAYGLEAFTVERTADFAPALAAALAAPNGGLLHVRTSVEEIAPGRTLSAIRGG